MISTGTTLENMDWIRVDFSFMLMFDKVHELGC